MDERLYNPLEFYEKYGKEEHNKNVTEYFDGLLASSGVDAAANRATVEKYNQQMTRVDHFNRKLRGFKVLRVFMIIFTVIAFIAAIVFLSGRYYGNALDIVIPLHALPLALY